MRTAVSMDRIADIPADLTREIDGPPEGGPYQYQLQFNLLYLSKRVLSRGSRSGRPLGTYYSW